MRTTTNTNSANTTRAETTYVLIPSKLKGENNNSKIYRYNRNDKSVKIFK